MDHLWVNVTSLKAWGCLTFSSTMGQCHLLNKTWHMALLWVNVTSLIKL